MVSHRLTAFVICLFASYCVVAAQIIISPYGLTVNMLPNTEQVFLNGYPVNNPLEEAVTCRENWQFTEISTTRPVFGWILPSTSANTTQTAYRILVASGKELLARDSADLWDIGKINSDQSLHIPYNGKQLKPGSVCFWKVKTWDNYGRESQFSEIARFMMADELVDYATDRHPIQKQDDYPSRLERVNENTYLTDFGKASFGRLRLNLYSETGNDSIYIHLGEAMKTAESIAPRAGPSVIHVIR